MTTALPKIDDTTAKLAPSQTICATGVEVPCLQGFVAKTFHKAADIPRQTAHDFLLEYVATQAAVYQRVNGRPVDAVAHIAGFWANLHKVLPPQGSYYLAWTEVGTLVGTGALRRVDETTAEMKHLYVRPAARGTGLGRWLVEQRIRDARAMGMKAIIADTLRGNVEMPKLYAKLGFHEVQPNRSSASLVVNPQLEAALHYFRMDLA